MYGLPFPEASPEHAEASTSEQLLLRKEVAQRFGHSGAYRDLPFAVLFLLQLCHSTATTNNFIFLNEYPPALAIEKARYQLDRRMKKL